MNDNDEVKQLRKVSKIAERYGIDINELGFGNIEAQRDSLDVLPIQLEYINSYCKLLHNEIKLIKHKLRITYSEETQESLNLIKLKMKKLHKQMLE